MSLHPAVRALLWPVSLLYGGIVRLRAWIYGAGIPPRKRLRGVVVSVGNLTLGGTGKTPLVMWLVERLLAEGKRVAILSRGYRGSAAGNIPMTETEPVPEEHEPPKIFSDEVWLYWKRFEQRRKEKSLLLGIGADRWEQGRRLEGAGAEWFLLDDGFQHLRLARDVDIVLVDSTDPFGGGKLLPAGRLREPRAALRRADVVVITRTEHAPALEAVIRRHSQASIFYAQTALTGMPQANPAQMGSLKADPQNRRFFVFCGIGNPAAFLSDLQRWKIQVAGSKAFPDHHAYSQRDLEEIQAAASAAGADSLVCTEKDLFNFRQLRIIGMPVFYCQIVLHIANASGFWNEVTQIAKSKRGDGAP